MSWNRKSFKNNRKPQRKYNEERQLQGLKVEVRNNDITKALRVLKKRMQNEGIFNELREREYYTSRSENRRRAKAAAIRRQRREEAKRETARGEVAKSKVNNKEDKRLPGGSEDDSVLLRGSSFTHEVKSLQVDLS